MPSDQYLVAVNPRRQPRPRQFDSPYSTTYCPGTSRPRDGLLLWVAEGEHVQAPDCWLPPKLREVQLRGIALWADGARAANAQVLLKLPNHDRVAQSVRTDGKGRFTFPVYETQSYVVSAVGSRGARLLRSSPVPVVAGESAAPLSLTLDRPAER